MDAFVGANAVTIQQAFPGEASGPSAEGGGLLVRPKTTRRTQPPRHLEGDEEYNSADAEGKSGRKRRYRVAEVRGSWSPEEDANLMQYAPLSPLLLLKSAYMLQVSVVSVLQYSLTGCKLVSLQQIGFVC